MSHGFLGNDASFMLDFVVCALVLLVPLLAFSLYTVKFRRNYELHRGLQATLAAILLVAVVAFEVDMRWHGGWKQIVNKDSEHPRLTDEELAPVEKVLYVHLVFAISTPVLWGATLLLAWKRFARPASPGSSSTSRSGFARSRWQQRHPWGRSLVS